jgi:nicotinamidase-related amidase
MLSYVNIANSEPKHKSASLQSGTCGSIVRLAVGARKRSRLGCARRDALVLRNPSSNEQNSHKTDTVVAIVLWGGDMSKRVSAEAALLMLHWQNSVCDPKGVWGKNLCRQIEKNGAVANAQKALATARSRGLLTIFVNIGWRPGFPELPENQYYPLLQGAKDENKGIVGTWEVDVIDALKPQADEPIVVNYGSDSFEGTDLERILRANNVGHLFVSGQCIEHVVATTIKRAANMGYNAILIKDATSGFTDGNYSAMLDILPLYSKIITANEFTLEAPYGGSARNTTFPASPESFSGRMLWRR